MVYYFIHPLSYNLFTLTYLLPLSLVILGLPATNILTYGPHIEKIS